MKIFSSVFPWHTFVERMETYLAAKSLKCKKSLNLLTNRIGFGIYFYKNISINLNRLNKELLEVVDDVLHFHKSMLPSFISVSDGIKATMFSNLPNNVIQQILTLVSELPAYKALQLALNRYGYKCELQRHQGQIFFGSLQIHFTYIHKRVPISN